MINTQELRLRNLVEFYSSPMAEFKSATSVGAITAIAMNTVQIEGKNIEYLPGVKGIEIDADWLIKLGFKKIWPLPSFKDQMGFKKGNFFVDKHPETLEIEVHFNKYEFENRTFVKSLQYIHQLQNLYFDLTDEELAIV